MKCPICQFDMKHTRATPIRESFGCQKCEVYAIFDWDSNGSPITYYIFVTLLPYRYALYAYKGGRYGYQGFTVTTLSRHVTSENCGYTTILDIPDFIPLQIDSDQMQVIPLINRLLKLQALA